jgi:hypothetical protein
MEVKVYGRFIMEIEMYVQVMQPTSTLNLMAILGGAFPYTSLSMPNLEMILNVI